MRLVAILLASMTMVALAGPAPAAAESGWHSEQPVAAGIGVPVSLGEVGDIACRQANRCVLITAGNGGMPAGIYAYDGAGWHLYATVCGGHQGRIAWAGPDDFWTISDQRPGEESTAGGQMGLNRSLCHFENGEVVASYAEPIGQATSFSRMDAAACLGPSDCWFAGERLGGEDPNPGAFHLHWNGSTLSEVPSLAQAEPDLADPGRAVFDLAPAGGRVFESAVVRPGDVALPAESEPAFFHRLEFGAAQPFEPLLTPGLDGGGSDEGLEGFRFAGDGSSLWAISGASAESAGEAATAALARLEGGAFEAVPLTGAPFATGERILGFALEPPGEAAWVAAAPRGAAAESPARLVQIGADGGTEGEVQLPEPQEELNPKGTAGPIACPAAGQCWMATRGGWLFHLGGPLPVDTDPAMHQLITFRPCDDACRSETETGLPEDDSGAEPEPKLFPETEAVERLPTRRRKPKPLYTHLHQKLVDDTVLQLTFVLHARAHVQLLAKLHKQVVAKTPLLTLGTGHHRLRLRLDPERWPTHLSFQVHRLRGKSAS